jgi:hypothetical protein
MSTWAPTSALVKRLKWQLRGYTQIAGTSHRQSHLSDAIASYVLKGGWRGGHACLSPVGRMVLTHHARPPFFSSRRPFHFTSYSGYSSTCRNQSSSPAIKKAQSIAHPRYVLQQNLAKCARDAEASQIQFPTKESLDEVESILG